MEPGLVPTLMPTWTWTSTWTWSWTGFEKPEGGRRREASANWDSFGATLGLPDPCLHPKAPVQVQVEVEVSEPGHGAQNSAGSCASSAAVNTGPSLQT